MMIDRIKSYLEKSWKLDYSNPDDLRRLIIHEPIFYKELSNYISVIFLLSAWVEIFALCLGMPAIIDAFIEMENLPNSLPMIIILNGLFLSFITVINAFKYVKD